MSRRILFVTPSQVEAAKLLVEAAEAEGREPDPRVQRIALASPGTAAATARSETEVVHASRPEDSDDGAEAPRVVVVLDAVAGKSQTYLRLLRDSHLRLVVAGRKSDESHGKWLEALDDLSSTRGEPRAVVIFEGAQVEQTAESKPSPVKELDQDNEQDSEYAVPTDR